MEFGSTPAERKAAEEHLKKLKAEKGVAFKAGAVGVAFAAWLLLSGGTGGAILATLAAVGSIVGGGVSAGVATLILGGGAIAKLAEETAAVIHELSERDKYLLGVNALLQAYGDAGKHLAFISYNQRDSQKHADTLCTTMQKHYPSANVFLDTRMGHFDLKDIPTHITNSVCVIIVLSTGYLTSRNCMVELIEACNHNVFSIVYQHPAFDPATYKAMGEVAKFTSMKELRGSTLTKDVLDPLLEMGYTLKDITQAYKRVTEIIGLKTTSVAGTSDMELDANILTKRFEEGMLAAATAAAHEEEKKKTTA